jgi:succinoglycan biosynthesis protein ExoW
MSTGAANPAERAMTKVSVIIPYFQRDAGILSRALTSVFVQKLDAAIDVIVINDASPADPAIDIAAAGAPPAHVSIKLIGRENGGPAAARNSGFAAIGADTDFIALLDSDDTWRADHLERALAGLGGGCDVYFSDHLQESGKPYLPSTRLQGAIAAHDPALTPAAGQRAMMMCAGARMAEFATREYLAHTSSIVYRAAKLRKVRMTEALRSAGEDHLFFMDLALASDRVCFSLESEVVLGKGVNIYVSAFEWGTAKDLRRRAFNLAALKLMRDRAAWPAETRDDLRKGLKRARRTVGYLVFRRLAAHRALDLGTIGFLWRVDPMTLLSAPANVLLTAAAPQAEAVPHA